MLRSRANALVSVHLVVNSGASPDDPALADYWAWRRRKSILPINNTTLRLFQAQDGRCPICKTTLFADDQQPHTPSDWEAWLTSTRTTITIVKPLTPDTADTVSYTPIATARHFCPPTSHQGSLEPDAGKLARPVG